MSLSQMHSGQSSASQMQGMAESQKQGTMGLIANNILGSPATLPAGGLAVIVVASTIALATSAFVISRRQRSFVVAGLLAAAGVTLVVLPLANMNFMIPGPLVGVIVGFVILALGVTEGIGTAKMATKSKDI